MTFLFRYQWENEFQWKARQIFIKTYREKFDDVRLASLSNAWSNWRFHGCTYGSAVQALLVELDKDLPSEMQMAMKEIPSHRNLNEVKFQKSYQNPQCAKRSRLHQHTTVSNELVRGLILYLPLDESTSNPISILTESAQKSRKKIEFKELEIKLDDCKEIEYETALVIEGTIVAKGMARNKKESKRDCATRALEILKGTQQLHMKQKPNHDSLKSIEKGNLVKSAFVNANRIEQDNVGNMMLRKMGWTGKGGLGKHGISEPIFIESSDGRKGLGHTGDTNKIERQSIEQTLVDFIRNSTENDIKFSNELSKEERALVHTLCQKYGLKHKSFGTGDERYLVVNKN